MEKSTCNHPPWFTLDYCKFPVVSYWQKVAGLSQVRFCLIVFIVRFSLRQRISCGTRNSSDHGRITCRHDHIWSYYRQVSYLQRWNESSNLCDACGRTWLASGLWNGSNMRSLIFKEMPGLTCHNTDTCQLLLYVNDWATCGFSYSGPQYDCMRIDVKTTTDHALRSHWWVLTRSKLWVCFQRVRESGRRRRNNWSVR